MSVTQIFEQDDNLPEGTLRLKQDAHKALDALAGRLDAASVTKEKASALSGESASDAELLALPMFNAFISHKRSSAQDFARSMHSLLVGQKIATFLDVENLDRIDELSMIVAGCDVVRSACAYLSPHIHRMHTRPFRRPICPARALRGSPAHAADACCLAPCAPASSCAFSRTAPLTRPTGSRSSARRITRASRSCSSSRRCLPPCADQYPSTPFYGLR